MPRKRALTQDEEILLLDLFSRMGRNAARANYPDVIALSELLSRLPFQPQEATTESFRNPAGT